MIDWVVLYLLLSNAMKESLNNAKIYSVYKKKKIEI